MSPEGGEREASNGYPNAAWGLFCSGRGDPVTEERAKRKLAAIFSADVKGYSRLMADDEEATVRTINSYREVMTGLIKGHDGRVADAKGDNVLAEFPSVVDAVRCAVQVQKELKERNSELREDRRMEFRIGINLGDVIEEQTTIYGDGVNVAARLEGLAEGGGICISGTTFDQVKNRVSVGYDYQGKQTVKNIPDPVRVYKVLMEPEAAGKVYGEEKSARTKRRWAAVATAAVLAVAAGGLTWNFYSRAPKIESGSKEKMAFTLPDKPSIAVLPFDNLSADFQYESLADGVSESIIYTLSYLPDMFVIARNSTFTYKGKPVRIRQVAEDLGVQYVLEGSVMRADDRVRVTAQLIDAISGYHIWSGRYDRGMKDFFGVLDDITKSIAIELHAKVSSKLADLTRKTQSFDAWASAVRAYSLITRGNKENLFEGHKLAEKAVALDPIYGFGWAVLAVAHTLECVSGFSESPAESISLAAECNEKALNLDPELSCATANRGQIYMLQGKLEEGISLGEKAIAMAPSLDTNYAVLGVILSYAGKFEEAIPIYKKAMRLNPFYPSPYLWLYATSCLMAKRYDEAREAFSELFKRAQKEEFFMLDAHLGLCAVYANLGKKEEARSHVLEILKINPNFSIQETKKTYRWRDPEYTEWWLNSLRKAGLK
jgi:adenylate cyclase